MIDSSTSCVETTHKTCRSPRTEGIEAMAQVSGPGLAWLAPGLSFALRNPKPKPEEAKPAQHYLAEFKALSGVFRRFFLPQLDIFPA